MEDGRKNVIYHFDLELNSRFIFGIREILKYIITI